MENIVEKNQFCRREFIKHSVSAGMAVSFAGKNLFAEEIKKEKKSVLIIWGGWIGHEP